jgi:hypothetical protein
MEPRGRGVLDTRMRGYDKVGSTDPADLRCYLGPMLLPRSDKMPLDRAAALGYCFIQPVKRNGHQGE